MLHQTSQEQIQKYSDKVTLMVKRFINKQSRHVQLKGFVHGQCAQQGSRDFNFEASALPGYME